MELKKMALEPPFQIMAKFLAGQQEIGEPACNKQVPSHG